MYEEGKFPCRAGRGRELGCKKLSFRYIGVRRTRYL